MEKKEGLQGRIDKLLQWPKYLIAVIILLTVMEFFIDIYAGVIMAALGIVVALLAILWRTSFIKSAQKELAEYAVDFTKEQRQQMLMLPVPYALMDKKGVLVWNNLAFEEVVPQAAEGERIAQMLPLLSRNMPADDEKGTEHIQWNERAYRAEVQRVSEEGGFYSLFLFDETERLDALRKVEEQKPVVGQVYIDNYEEVMNSAEQVRQSLIAALIERKIAKYFANYDGVVRKTEKDKFVVFMNKKGLNAVMENRFSLLEDVKTLGTGNSLAVTLSISMAADGATLEENHEFSRNAMDLALGRGGDQAVVKTPEYIRYYGGKTQRQEKNTRVKARVKAQALKEIILTRDQVLIMGHQIPDSDSFGSAVGIYRAAATMGKKAYIVIDKVPNNIRPMVNRFRNNSDYPEDMIISNEQALQKLDGNTAVCVVDVNRPSYTECPQLLDRAATIVVLDHHRQGGETVRKATLSYIEPYASSASELVAEILQYFTENMKLTALEAEALYAGIVIDTNNFMNKTGVRTFEAAAFLRRNGADVSRVRKLFRDRMEDTRARAKTISQVEMFRDSFAFGICPWEGVESPTIVCAQAANDMLDIVGVKASFVLTEFNDQIYISARSIDEVNVQLIMERLGGGGHLSVAGAQLKNMTITAAKELVQTTISQMMEEGAI